MPDTSPLVIPEDAIEVLSRDFEATPESRLLVNVPRANVTLQPGASNRIEIRVYMAGCDKDAAYAYLDDLGLRTRHAEDVVRVKPDLTPQHDTNWWRRQRERVGTMYVDLRLPRTCNADIQAAAGAIEAADLGGKLALEINAGRLVAANLHGQLEVFARSSELDLSGFKGKSAALNIYTSTLHLDGAEADRLDIEAAASPLRLRNLAGTTRITSHGGSTHVRTVRGSLRASVFGGRLDVADLEEAETELTASGGDIFIGLPSSAGADISLRADQIAFDPGLNFEGDREPEYVDGHLNGGGPALRARTHRGTIHCERD
ncbi:MAG: hypothetical protein GVY35_09830 [Bacteroidetes bacterium]|nr:hypothetical protein [Bacteroidota bacterium]